MSVLSVTCCSLFSAICAFTLVNAAGCGTDAQGVDDCRDIEQASCAAAKNCGTVTDVDACQRFYRDQCLHGLPVSPPSSSDLNLCLATIKSAGDCAMNDAGDTELSACEPTPSLSAPRAKTACDLVTHPEYAQECSFLAPGDDAGTVSSGGTGGSSEGGSSGSEDAAGSSGSAGAAGT
jgi:uncharacterized membrane protein YgcG